MINISGSSPLDLTFVAHAKIIGTDGRFMDLAITPETAKYIMTELGYHSRQLAERIANAPKLRDLSEEAKC
tara:strand:+ start:1882 stop:2094 length:213 start_codon:yes stop_codon:yes gene_type:complete